MIILLQNILFKKEFLACNCCFGLFSKIKKGSGAIFWCKFSAWKCLVFNTLSMDKISMSHLISFSIYQTKCIIKFLFRQLMTAKSLRFLLNQPLRQWLTGKEKGEWEITKIWISWERKELFRLNKKHFA